MPEDLNLQQSLCENLKPHKIRISGFQADSLIGSLMNTGQALPLDILVLLSSADCCRKCRQCVSSAHEHFPGSWRLGYQHFAGHDTNDDKRLIIECVVLILYLVMLRTAICVEPHLHSIYIARSLIKNRENLTFYTCLIHVYTYSIDTVPRLVHTALHHGEI